MVKLYLHVGTHKTGSTSLQAYLLEHKAALKALGTHVITETHREFGEVANCLGFAHSVLRLSLMTVARLTGDMPSRRSISRFLHRQMVRSQLKRLPKNASALISAEALCFARTPKERSALLGVFKGLDVEVIPVLCQRNNEDWKNSWESELKNWSDRMTHEFGNETDDIRGEWYFDADAIFQFWSEIGPVRTVDFDASVSEVGSVLPALLSVMEIPDTGNTDRYFLRRR